MSSVNINRTLLNTVTSDESPDLRISSLEESRLVSSLPAQSILVKAGLTQLFLFEVFGMTIFSYGLTCTSNDGVDIQVTISLLMGIIISGYLCGANFNPCITLMNLIRKESRFTLKVAGTLLSGQFVGAMIGTSIGILTDGVI